MRKYILIALMLIGSVAWQPVEETKDLNGYVIITNNRYTGVRVYIWYASGGEWEVIQTMNITGQGTRVLSIGQESHYKFGYTTKGDTFIHQITSDHIYIY